MPCPPDRILIGRQPRGRAVPAAPACAGLGLRWSGSVANVFGSGRSGRRGQGQIVDWLSRRPSRGRFQGLQFLPQLVSTWYCQAVAAAVGIGCCRTSCRDRQRLLLDPLRCSKRSAGSRPAWSSRGQLRIAECTLICRCQTASSTSSASSNSASALARPNAYRPAYEDKVGRRAIRLMDLADLDALAAKIDRLLAHHNALRRGSGLPEIAAAKIYDELAAVAPKVLPFMDSVWALLDGKRREGKRILFEGAQAVLLDIDHGTYPFVTSSNTVAGQAATGSGLGRSRSTTARYLRGLYDAGRGGAVFDRKENDIGRLLGTAGASSAP